jgi:hypothetical protein
MASPVDTLTVSGISWSQAMENAVQALARSDRYTGENMMKQAAFIQYVQANSSLAQAWIAVAREITMHARAAG